MMAESSVSLYEKLIYIGAFCTCTLMYVWVRNKLAKKMSNKDISIRISKVYCYGYLGVIILISRFVMSCILKNEQIGVLKPSFSIGLGSYINYGLGETFGNQMYANVIVNSLLVFIASIFIKKIILNITSNDMLATTSSLLYIFAPQSLWLVNNYIKYNYNVVLVLLGIYVFLHIIEEVKNFNEKTNKYLVYSLVLGGIQSLDIIFGGSYIIWMFSIIVAACASMYVDVVRINIPFKAKLNYKLKILAEKMEKVNISKLVYVCFVSLGISGLTTWIYSVLSSANNYQMFSAQNAINVLQHSRNYYLVFIIIAVVFEIIAIITKRKLDIKIYVIKLMFMVVGFLTFYTVDGTYASARFDTLMILNTVMLICNICYNGEERIKLLKEKN